jgi:hypothetical protein
MKRFLSILSCSALILFCIVHIQSCMNRQFIKGQAEIISISDSTLNDSSLFVGYVYEHPDHWPNRQPIQDAQVWLNDQTLKASTNLKGYYYLKTVPGTYTVKCQRNLNMWPQLVLEVKDVKINKNEKVQIDFYLGYTIE